MHDREVGSLEGLPDVVVTTVMSPDLPPERMRREGFRTTAEFAIPVFLFRGKPRPEDQPLFYDRMPVEVMERSGSAPRP